MRPLLLLALLGLAACADEYDPRLDPSYYKPGAKQIGLPCGLAVYLGKVSAGIGDVVPGHYNDADGHRAEGPTVTLYYVGANHIERSLTIGEGTVFELGGAAWRVVKVKYPPKGGAIVERIRL